MGSIVNHLRQGGALFRPGTEGAQEDRNRFFEHSPHSFLQAVCRIDMTVLSPEHRECGDQNLNTFKAELNKLVGVCLKHLFKPDGAATSDATTSAEPKMENQG